MKLSTALTLLVAVTLSVAAKAWNMGRFPSYGLVMRPFVVSSPVKDIFEQQNALVNKAFRQTSPRYEIMDDEKKFQISVDVPGVKLEDIKVSVDESENVLSISGQRASISDSHKFTSKFSQSFSLDPAVDVEKLTASLNHGVLIVSAPKDFKRVEQAIRSIPVVLDETTPAVEPVNTIKAGDHEPTSNAKAAEKKESAKKDIKAVKPGDETSDVHDKASYHELLNP